MKKPIISLDDAIAAHSDAGKVMLRIDDNTHLLVRPEKATEEYRQRYIAKLNKSRSVALLWDSSLNHRCPQL